ncbi:MAG: hypothetical protein AB1726_01460 [Planctomycetota bacterium]
MGMRSFFLLFVACLLPGCVTRLGPRTVVPARFDYNQAIAQSNDEQMLLNLVRLRYRDTPQFLSVSSVLSQYSLEGSASASAEGNGERIWSLGTGISYGERPTITYTPLQGEEFARRMLTPIAPEALILLAQSGWSIERLAQCCVEQINALRNVPSAFGPTPVEVPRFEEFRRFSRGLQELQDVGLIDLVLEITGSGSADERQETWMYVQTQPPPEWAERVAETRRLLGLPADVSRFRLSACASGESNEISIRSRSIFGMLFYLSQAVEVPPVHEAEGKVTGPPVAAGGELDWFEATGHIFRIRSQSAPPAGAFVAVRYREHWFYIADDDLESKTTFSLINLLFAQQAAPSVAFSPLVTVGT